MKILSVSAQAFKGRDFTQEFAPVTLLCGDNFVGKSARIQALTLALCNYVPGVSSKPSELFERLASGNPMTVTVFTDAFDLTRKYEERSGKLKYTVIPNGVADDYVMPSMSLDPTEFFELSGPARTKAIFARVKSDLNIDSIRNSVLSNVKNIKLDPHEALAEQAIALAVKELNEAFDQAKSEHLNVQATVERIVSAFVEIKRLADQNAKRLAATVQGLTQVASTDPAAAAGVEQQLAQAREALEKANTEVGRLRGVGESLAKELASIAEKAVTVNQGELFAKIEQLSSRLADHKKVDHPGPFDLALYPPGKDHEVSLAELAAKKAVLFTLSQENMTDELKLKLAAARAQDRLTNAEKDVAPAGSEWQRLVKELAETESETTCSKCGQSLVALKGKVIALLNERIIVAHSEMNRLMEIANNCKRLYGESFAAYSEVASSNQKIMDAKDGYRLLEQQTLTIRAKIEQEAQAEWNKASHNYTTAQAEINRLEKQISELRAKMEDRTAAEALAKLPELEQSLENARVEYRTASESSINAKSAVTDLEEKGRQLQRQRAEAQTRQRTVDESDRSRTEAQVMKLVCEFLAEMQGEIIKRAVGPLLDKCNTISEPILGRPLCYQDGEIGFIEKTGKFVGTKTMSGTELAMTFCAVSIALATESPIKLLILDELGRLDPARRLKLANHLCRLVRNGVLDQAILVDTNDQAYASISNPDFQAFKL